jgi:hypothetical protein
VDRLELYELHVDWVTPANSTFAGPFDIPITSFTYTVCGFFSFNCIYQLDTVARFDAVSEWPMFRFPYRNFVAYESLVGSFVVGGGRGEVGAAIRWFELRRTVGPWALYQEGTQDPGDNHDHATEHRDGSKEHRLGYTVSSSAIHPRIRYVTRRASDPLGTLQAKRSRRARRIADQRQPVGRLFRDGGRPGGRLHLLVPTNTPAANSASNWSTAVGVFAIPQCLPGLLNLPLVLR